MGVVLCEASIVFAWTDRTRLIVCGSVRRVKAGQTHKNQFSTYGRFRRLFIFTPFQITRVRWRWCAYGIIRDCMYFIFRHRRGSRCKPIVELNERALKSAKHPLANIGSGRQWTQGSWTNTCLKRYDLASLRWPVGGGSSRNSIHLGVR